MVRLQRRIALASRLRFVFGLLWLAAGLASATTTTTTPTDVAGSDDGSTTALTVEGISHSSGDDDPRVLYILPWQAPTLPRRPRAELEDSAPELLEPLDPSVLEHHRKFRETLDPAVDSALTVQ